MKLIISSVDYAPEDLYDQVPFTVDLLREMPGADRPDYWIGKVSPELKWLNESHEHRISHLILAARWEGTRIGPGAKDLPVGIAYVTDESLLKDNHLDFAKCQYVAIGVSHEIVDGK